MYSYLPHELRLQGLSLGELPFANFDENLQEQKEYVEIALKLDKENIQFVPAQYLINEQQNKGFSFEKFIKSFDEHPRELSIFIGKIYAQKEKIHNMKVLESQSLVTELLINSYYDDNCSFFLKNLDKNHPLFTDITFIKKVVANIKKKIKTLTAISNIISNIVVQSPSKNVIRADMEIAQLLYLGSGHYSGFTGIVDTIKDSPEELLLLLSFVYGKNNQNKSNVDLYTVLDLLSKKHKVNENFMKKLIAMIPDNKIDVDFIINCFDPKFIKDLNILHLVLSHLIKSGKMLSSTEWYIKNIKLFVEKNPELTKFAVNNIEDFFFQYTDGYFHTGRHENNKITLMMLPMVDVKSMSPSMVKHWISEMKTVDLEIKELIKGKPLKTADDLEKIIEFLKKDLINN